MQSEWQEKSLGELVSLQRGYDLPSHMRVAGEVPVAGSAGISGFHNRSNVRGPGVVIGRSGVGSMGVVSFIDRDFWALNTTLFVTDFKGNDERFIYYLLKSINFRQFDTGSAQASLNRNLVYPFRVLVPGTVEEQRALASVLATIERRIELLQQTNGVLESIAQALFKSWFIDFDPVRAKADGREPEGMDLATAALFPAEFEESAVGLIPKGWRIGRLGDVLKQRVERTKPSAQTAVLPYVPIECISSKSAFLREFLPGEQAQSSLTLFRSGDVLFGAMRPYFHKVCLAPFDGVTRTTAFTLQPRAWQRAFALLAAFHESTIEYATNHSEGSTIPYAKWSGSLESKALVIPPLKIAAAFDDVVVPLLDAGMHNTERTRSLAEARDSLLPRLISGKLRLPEAEAKLEEAAE